MYLGQALQRQHPAPRLPARYACAVCQAPITERSPNIPAPDGCALVGVCERCFETHKAGLN